MNSDMSPVLVVGGRTTGLMMAAELARHGIPVRIVDASPGIDPHCRATLLHSRTLEILHTLGIEEPLVATGQPYEGTQIYANGRFVGRSHDPSIDSRFPTGIALSQAQTEQTLEQHLNSLGVHVERNTRLVEMDQHPAEHPGSVRAALQHPSGRCEVFDTPWLVGCDGAHSTVRHLSGEMFPGAADRFRYLLADVVIENDRDLGDAIMFLCDDGVLYFFILNDGRRLICANVPTGHDTSRPPTLAQVQELVDQRTHATHRLADPRWLTYFQIHYRLAPHYRHGRTFLAGDAAHVHSLLGGQGMNTGIQDAHNLAWKLAMVVRGQAPETWLDTYEIERRRVAEDVIKNTRSATESAELFAGLSAKEREQLLQHMFVPPGEEMRARRHAEEVDLDYRSSPICFEPEGAFATGPHAGSQAPDVGPVELNRRTGHLLDLVTGPQHRLLLFAGDSSETEAFATLSRLTTQADRDWLTPYLVTLAKNSTAPTEVSVVSDPAGDAHRRYGAKTGGIYLIRPDGYIAYRGQDMASFRDFVSQIFNLPSQR